MSWDGIRDWSILRVPLTVCWISAMTFAALALVLRKGIRRAAVAQNSPVVGIFACSRNGRREERQDEAHFRGDAESVWRAVP
ncbi:MAG: hypothetical protein ABR985_00550 [Methanotrichaceae archaeon]